MRETPAQLGRALADRLRRRHATLATTGEPARPITTSDELAPPASRAMRLRRMLGSARVTPYQLRRGWLWY